MGDFNIRFKKMVRDTQKALRESKADPREIVSVLLLADAEFQNRYEKSGLFDSLLVAADVLDLFIKLNKHWDHFNYYLLEQLIAEPGIEEFVADNFIAVSRDLIQRMKHYVEEMEDFRRRAAVEIYCKVVHQPKDEVPDGFKQLVKEYKLSEMKTLQDVEEFRREVACQYKLYQCLVFLKYIELGSVKITLWIPLSAGLTCLSSELELEVFSDDDDTEGILVDHLPPCDELQVCPRTCIPVYFSAYRVGKGLALLLQENVTHHPPEIEELSPDSEPLALEGNSQEGMNQQHSHMWEVVCIGHFPVISYISV